jgi:hypothetical protein
VVELHEADVVVGGGGHGRAAKLERETWTAPV